METKAKKKTYNIIMVALIAVIAVCGILAVGHIQGWFGSDSQGAEIVSQEIKGVVNIERSGVGYSLEKDVELKDEDIVETRNGSEASFALSGKNLLALNENSELQFPKCTDGEVGVQLNRGECFADIPDAPEAFSVAFGKNTATIKGTVFSVSQQKNSSTLTVYEGAVEVTAEDGSTNSVEAGQQILISRNADNKLLVETSQIKETYLSDYLIEKLLACKTKGLCFSEKQLNKVIADRETEKKAEAKALEQEAIKIAESEQAGESADVGTGEAGSADSAGSDGTAASSGESGGGVKTCTISIRCKSILNNMDKLKSGKNRYVPSNGVILSTSSVEFQDGETAYDVTKRACSATGIQIEASYSPIYGSYYVEGIGHLYEFDCGEMSGWLYKVNGWTPNYGCSEYKLKNGDSIVWDYTCTGY